MALPVLAPPYLGAASHLAGRLPRLPRQRRYMPADFSAPAALAPGSRRATRPMNAYAQRIAYFLAGNASRRRSICRRVGRKLGDAHLITSRQRLARSEAAARRGYLSPADRRARPVAAAAPVPVPRQRMPGYCMIISRPRLAGPSCVASENL